MASSGAMETLLLPEGLIRSLKTLSQSQNVTMFALLLTAFGALLNRYTGQEDMVISSPVANRKLETEPLIGPFAGVVACWVALATQHSTHSVIPNCPLKSSPRNSGCDRCMAEIHCRKFIFSIRARSYSLDNCVS
jgi:hypothetical protein